MSVRTSTSIAPSARFCSDLSRSKPQQFDSVSQQRALVELDDRLKVRGLRAEFVKRLSHEFVFVGDGECRIVGALITDRR